MLTRSTKLPSEPHTLGELALTANNDVNLDLLGGANAAPRGRTYHMEHDDASKNWLIYLNTKSASGRPVVRTDIARVAVRDQKLMFLWLEGATPEKAGYLFNCALDVRVDSKSCFLAFAPPQQVKPLTVNLDGRESRTPLPSDRLPAPELLQLQVTGLEGPFPVPKFEPGDTVSATKELKAVLESDELPKISFQVKLDTKARSASITTTAKFQVAGGPETEFTRQAAQELGRRLVLQGQIVEKEVQTARSKRAKGELGKQLEGIKKAVGQLGKLDAFYSTVNRKGKIHFRIFTMIDSEHKVTLMETSGSEPGE